MIQTEQHVSVDLAPHCQEDQFRLAPEFWDFVVGSYWNKKPLLIKRPFGQRLLSEAEIFDILLQHSDDYRSRKKRFLKVYVDNGQRLCGLSDLLPAASDHGYKEFQDRIQRDLDGKDAAFFFFECHVYNPELWGRVRRFLNPLIERIGVPAAAIDVDMVVGKYKRTPTGIHKDAAANFSYIATGEKRMLFWPSETFDVAGSSAQLGDEGYERYLDKAIDVYAEAGDIIFWPPSFWHMAASPSLPCAWATTVNIAIYQEMMPSHLVQQFLGSAATGTRQQELNQPFGPAYLDSDSQSTQATITDAVTKQTALLSSICAQPGLERFLEDVWFKKASASGFVSTPPPRPLDETVFRARQEFSIDQDARLVLQRRDANKSSLYVNGVMVPVRHYDAIAQLVGMLRTHTQLQMDEVDQLAVGEDSADTPASPAAELRKIVRILYSLRVIH